jgi:hypothetical protein
MNRERRSPAGPLGLMAAVQAVALAVTVVAAMAGRGETEPDRQMPWLVLAAAAAALSGVVNGAWLLVARRHVGRRYSAVSARIVALHDRRLTAGTFGQSSPAEAGLVALVGSKLYHRPGCALLDGRPASARRPSTGSGSGHQPCGWCAS